MTIPSPWLFILAVVFSLISSAIFIGTGYLIILVIPFTLFQATMISMISIFVIAVVVSIFYVLSYFLPERLSQNFFDGLPLEEDNDDDDELDDEKVVPIKKIGRNKPCNCGSGKKYKNCCEKDDIPF